MPWYHLDPNDEGTEEITESFGISGIPQLKLLNSKGKAIGSRDPKADIQGAKSDKTKYAAIFEEWSKISG